MIPRRRRVGIEVALVAAGLSVVWWWYGGTPRVGGGPTLPDKSPISIELGVLGQPSVAITNPAALASVMEMLRSGRSVEVHKCKDRGRMKLLFADGESLSVSLIPGHNFLRYEFGVSGELFAVSRRRFLGALQVAGVEVHRIPTQ